MRKKSLVDWFLTRKRERKALKRRLRYLARRASRARAQDFRLRKAGVFGSSSEIARMLSLSASRELPLPQTSLRVTVPAKFSMLDAPQQVLKLVSEFALTHRNRTISDVTVDMASVAVQDLGAHALLDKLVDEIASEAKMKNRRVGWRGSFPQDAGRRRFVAAMGIVRQLGLTARYFHVADAGKIHLFERHCRYYVRQARPPNPNDKSEQANAAERFSNHIDRCLQREGRALTAEGRMQLCNYVVEIIDNAETHAGMVDWTIQGYIDTALDEPQCEVVIFNFGKSIAETLDELPDSSYTKVQIQKYLDLHQSNGWFGPQWRKEDLLTLIALQGTVSSRNITENHTRGQGTADLIEFFQLMNDERGIEGNSPATMYIVSGGTRVLFDPKYRMETIDGGPRLIAFNADNDLKQPPDPLCVMPLVGCRLPGTMIGIKFAVKASILQASPAALASGASL